MNTLNTEDKILKAAEREFLDKGYAGARTTTIAEAAGVTHAMLHYYFRTKEKLFKHIVGEKVKKLKGLILIDLLDSDKPVLDKVKAAVETHFDFITANSELPKFILTMMSDIPEFSAYFKEKVKEDNHDIIKIFQNEIDRSAEAGLCRRIDARMLLLDILSLNAFSFIAGPFIENVLGEFNLSEEFLRERKKNNVEMIMQKLRP